MKSILPLIIVVFLASCGTVSARPPLKPGMCYIRPYSYGPKHPFRREFPYSGGENESSIEP
jgi:hypothetical protein